MQLPLLGALGQLPGPPTSAQDVEGGCGQVPLPGEPDALHQRKRFAVHLAPWGALAESCQRWCALRAL